MKLKWMAVLIVLTMLIVMLVGLSPAQTTTEQKKESSGVVEARPLKTKIFEIKYRDPEELQRVLSGLSSEDPKTTIRPNREFKTITVRDHPENIASMEEALKRLDVPEASQASFEVQLHLIAASSAPTEKNTIPKNLEPVLSELQSTLKYGGYRFITTILNRVQDGGAVRGNGFLDPIFKLPSGAGKTTYSFALDRVRFNSDPTGRETIHIGKFSFDVNVPVVGMVPNAVGTMSYQGVGLTTELSLREGELVVVGTTNVGSSDEAIIVVISMKKVK